MGWPRFEPATFLSWDSVPDDARDALMAARLPKSFFGRRYVALAEPVAQLRNGRHLVRFGDVLLFGGIFYDPSTGQVLQLPDAPGAASHIVNSTLDQFTSTVRAVIDMFPFYSDDSELEQRMEVAASISAAIGRLDAAALDPDGFWGTFLDDVVNGDFATEDVVGTARGSDGS